jgi:hypothetical protein
MSLSYSFSGLNYQQPQKIELNLDNPIFVFYICVQGFSRQRAQEYIQDVKNQFDIYSNITMWIVATDEPTKIECVYDGKGRTKDSEIAGLIEQINERITVLGQSNSFEDFKINIRDWRIDKIVKHLNEEDK